MQIVEKKWRMPDELWVRMEPLLPKDKPHPKGGRPYADHHKVMDGIFYVLRTGCQWKAAPIGFAPGSTLHRYFQKWTEAGVFEKFWKVALKEYDQREGIKWKWQSLDGAMTKAPLGGEKTGPNTTDRAKIGTKWSLMTDGAGVPLAIAVGGANTHDMKLVPPTLQAMESKRRKRNQREQEHLCADKGYDYPEIRTLLRRYGYTAHIKFRGEGQKDRQRMPSYRARRWVVERTHSWMNRFRRLLIRWEKKVKNDLSPLHFACAWITFHAAKVLG